MLQSTEKAHDKVQINGVRMVQKKGVKSGAGAEEKLLVWSWRQKGRSSRPEKMMWV